MAADGPDADDELVSHLEAALDVAEDGDVRYHIRQALQHAVVADDPATED